MDSIVLYEIGKQRHEELIAEANRHARARRASQDRAPFRSEPDSGMRAKVIVALRRLVETFSKAPSELGSGARTPAAPTKPNGRIASRV